MRIPKRLAVVVAGGVLVTGIGAGIALADPSGAPTYRQFAGVGSDTTQDVMNAIANTVTVGGTKVLGSYDATGSSTITTKDPTTTPACSGLARPNGSGAGRAALLNSLTAGNGCLQFSRSSSLNLTASTPSLTYVPFMIDAVSYAVTSTSAISRQLNLTDLQHYYTCDPNYVGTSSVPASNSANTYGVTPILPQAGSGTRSYWEGKMGITDADVNNGLYPCLLNGSKNGQIIEEHTGTLVDDKSIAPFSIAQYNAQSTGVISDKRGRTVLGSIGSGAAGAAVSGLTFPNQMNASFNVSREVYNVIPTASVSDPAYSQVFVGNTSLVCQDTADITKYGFAPDPNCGSTTQHS